MKIDISEIEEALKIALVEPDKQKEVLNHLQEVIKELEENKAAGAVPKQKNEFGVIIYSDEPEWAQKEFTASVYTIPQGSDHGQVLAKISQAARESNEAAKKKKNIIETIGDAFQNLKRKWAKEKGVNFKTKIPVRVLISNNKLV